MSAFVPTPSGQTVETPFHIRNKFKFYNIVWKIEHFFLQTCEDNWEICSPEFLGYGGARLKLILKPSQNEDISDFTFSFTVRRSVSDTGPETLWVNCRACFADQAPSEKHNEMGKLCSLNRGSEMEISGEMDVSRISGVFDEAKNAWKKLDSLIIKCIVIIYCEGVDFGLECSTAGMKSLSEDMLALFESALDFDIEFKIGNSLLQLHKAVLCARCEWFAAIIHKEVRTRSPENLVIDLSNTISDTHYEGMRKILAFIYTGNLTHILEKPSLEIYDLACILNDKELKTCYTPETLHFFSTVDAQEFSFNCYIQDYNSVFENQVSLSTPNFAVVCSGRTWLFHIHPRNDEEGGFLAIYAETNEEIISTNVCLEISTLDVIGCDPSTTKMLRTHVNGSSVVGFEEIEYRNWIRGSGTGEILHLQIKIKLSNDKPRSYVRKHFIPTLNAAPESTAYNKLSLDMKGMLNDGEFYDAEFLVHNDIILAHRCILEARCKTLSDMVKANGEDTLLVHGMTSGSLSVVLGFLYCGCIYDMEDHDVGNVLVASKHFNIPILTEYCLDFLAPLSPEDCSDGT